MALVFARAHVTPCIYWLAISRNYNLNTIPVQRLAGILQRGKQHFYLVWMGEGYRCQHDGKELVMSIIEHYVVTTLNPAQNTRVEIDLGLGNLSSVCSLVRQHTFYPHAH